MKILSQMSGGYDSVACCIKLLDEGHTVKGLFFNLSQPYLEQERQAVQYASEFLTARHNNWLGFTTALAPMKLQTSSDDTPSEYIPVRNFVFSALSANFAIAEGYEAVAVGNKTTTVRPNDPYSFRDCSIEFYSMMQNAVAFCSEGDTEIQFLMPLINNNVALTRLRTHKNDSLSNEFVIQGFRRETNDGSQLFLARRGAIRAA